MLLKSCRCGKLIPQSVKMCEECEQRQQSRHMIYNNTRRDKRAAEFYVSKEWRAMRERIIEVYDNVDIYALYVENELLTCEPVHHIVELEDDWEQRLNPFNLIPLNHKTHNTTVRRGSHANGCHSGAGKNGNYENVRFAKMHKSPKHE